MKNKRIRSLTANPGLKLTALLVACLIWLVVTNSNDPVDTQLFSNVQINMVNQDSIADIGKVVEPKGNGTVTLRVTERQSVLSRLARNGSDFYVEADLENINEMDTVPLTVTCSNSAITWDEIEVKPSSLKVTLENKVEKEFPVTISTSGMPSAGYDVGSTSVTQGNTLLIAGPESIIKIINQVTAPINVSSLSGDTHLTAALRVYDKNGALLSESQMGRLEFKDSSGVFLNDASVSVQVIIWKVRDNVPIHVRTEGEPAEGYQVVGIETYPASTTLSGTEEALGKIGPLLELVDTVSVEGASENIRTEVDLQNTISQYSNLELFDGDNTTVSVEVRIEKSGVQTYRIPLSSVDMLHAPQGMKLVYTPADQITLSVYPEEDGLGYLDVEKDIKAGMDLSVIEGEGNYSIPVDIVLPEGYTLSRDITVSVNASVIETEAGADKQHEQGH